MDLAFIFTFLVLRCLSIEEEICALSISMRQTALGNLGPLFAALAGVEENGTRIASVAAKHVIRGLSGLKFVAMFEDGKSQGSPRKLSTRRQKMAEDRGFEPLKGCPLHAFQACALGRYANPPWRTLSVV